LTAIISAGWRAALAEHGHNKKKTTLVSNSAPVTPRISIAVLIMVAWVGMLSSSSHSFIGILLRQKNADAKGRRDKDLSVNPARIYGVAAE
jgi:hypothetical protein